MEMYEGYTNNRKKAEEAVKVLENEIASVLEQSTEKYQWLSYFSEHENIRELTRTVAVELIDKIRVFDKKHIEVTFNFDDCYQSIIGKLRMMGYKVENADGRLMIDKKEVG